MLGGSLNASIVRSTQLYETYVPVQRTKVYVLYDLS
jgi:hypothetical protein